MISSLLALWTAVLSIAGHPTTSYDFPQPSLVHYNEVLNDFSKNYYSRHFSNSNEFLLQDQISASSQGVTAVLTLVRILTGRFLPTFDLEKQTLVR